MFQVAATANRVTFTGTVATPKPTGSNTSSGTEDSGGGVSSGFGMTTFFAIGFVILGAFSVFI